MEEDSDEGQGSDRPSLFKLSTVRRLPQQPQANHTSRKGDLQSSVRVDQSIVLAIRLDSLLHKS